MAKIDYEKFIKEWQKSDQPDQVAKKLGITKDYAIQIASTLRSNQVLLKSMRKGPTKIDWGKLAKIARAVEKETHINN